MRLLLLGVLLLVFIPSARSEEDILRLAVGQVNDACTGQVVRPTIVLTASHCVGRIGDTETVVFTINGVESPYTGKLVWDSAERNQQPDQTLDLALIQIQAPWPYMLTTFAPAVRGARGRNVSYAIGIHGWDVWLDVMGVFVVDNLGEVVIYRGDTYPGSSGSVVVVGDSIIGMITNSAQGVQPPLLVGPTAERIQRALGTFDRTGPMRPHH